MRYDLQFDGAPLKLPIDKTDPNAQPKRVRIRFEELNEQGQRALHATSSASKSAEEVVLEEPKEIEPTPLVALAEAGKRRLDISKNR